MGFGGERGSQKPELVVLDWSRVLSCSAEGFAFFAVLTKQLAAHGMHVIICEPEAATIGHFLTDSGLRDLGVPIDWVSRRYMGRQTLKSLAPSALFSSSDTQMLEPFLEGLSRFLRTTSLNRDSLTLVMATAHECIQNVLSHSSAQFGAAVALLSGRKGAASIELGIADDGVGIASSIASHGEHSRLSRFTDSSVTETVLNQKLSRRPRADQPASQAGERLDGNPAARAEGPTERNPGSGSGGGMGRLIRRLIEHPGVAVRIRTGTAFVSLHSGLPDRNKKTDLTFGAGTQFILEMKLPP